MVFRVLTACGLLLLLTAACGKGAVPQAQMGKTEAEIRAAEVQLEDLKTAGPSDGTPTVELHLKLARDQLKEAQGLIKDKDMEEAERVLQRAETDASYALVTAREWEAKAKAEAAMAEVKKLQEQGGK